MNAEVAALILILAPFSLYAVLSGIELGVAMTRVEPRLAPAKPARRVFSPRLEITNVLLVLGALGMVFKFNEAAAVVVRETWPVLVLGLAALCLRAGLLTYLFIKKTAPGGKLPNYLFAVVSLVVPLSLGSAGIFMVTGLPFWQSGAGLALFGSLIAGQLALGLGFVYYIGRRDAPQGVVTLSRLLNVVLAGLLAIVLLVVLNSGNSHLLNLPYAYLAMISAGIVLAQAACMAVYKEWRMWWFLAGLALLAPFLIGLANYPYLIYPEVLLDPAVSL